MPQEARAAQAAIGPAHVLDDLWVPEAPHTSRDVLILVEQPAELVAPSDGDRLARRRLGSGRRGAAWPSVR
jgi:hypothetical protein